MDKKEYLELPDKTIRDYLWDRALVSFSYEKNNRRKHIGTGFIYKRNINDPISFVITATHVVKEVEKYNDNVYVIFQMDKKGGYVKAPFSNLKFIHLEKRDVSFALISLNIFMEKVNLEFPNIKPVMLSFTYREEVQTYEDYISDSCLVFGYTGNENTRSLNYKEYSFFWRSILLRENYCNIEKYTSILEPVGLDFDHKDMVELSEDLSLDNFKVTGNFPKLIGMSGCPCLHPKISPDNKFIIDNVIGILVEQLNRPPHNGKTVVISPIKPILIEIEKIFFQISQNPKNIMKYLSNTVC